MSIRMLVLNKVFICDQMKTRKKNYSSQINFLKEFKKRLKKIGQKLKVSH